MIETVAKARSLLAAPQEKTASPWAALFAAGLCASAAVLMAGVVILGPGVSMEPSQGAGVVQPLEP
ncbi:MAG: hypothetical protein J0M36_00920 [Caulobacterales bacterium]|nr:hypothetical protein [Caulobacterales bacterium]